MSDLITNSKVRDLVSFLEKIDLTNVYDKSLEEYMAITKVLEDFTKRVKNEMSDRILDGGEFEDYILASRKTLKVEDEAVAVKYLQDELNIDPEELYDSVLKSPKELLEMFGKVHKDKIGIVEKETRYLRKKKTKK